MTVYLPPDIQATSTSSEWLVSSAQVTRDKSPHELVRLWMRGKLVGLLLCDPGDGAQLMERLGLVARQCPHCGKLPDGDSHG